MTKTYKSDALLLSGTIRNLKVENTTAEVFFRVGDREGMAATGALAAAMGLSGMAAGMAAMSVEEMSEPVTKASFDLDGKHVDALLWNWPFKEGDEIQVVAEPTNDGRYTGFAVLDPKERIIVLYPHVSAGSKAHWKNVLRISFFAGIVISFISFLILALLGLTVDFNILEYPVFFSCGFVSCVIFSLYVGYRVGRRFKPFIKMADSIFSILGWNDVSNINLRKITKVQRRPDDPPAMGDSYFRY